MARPEGLEPPTLCFEAVRSTLPNLARGVANRADSASWGKFPQPAFSFVHFCLPPFCCRFPHFALHFRDSRVSRPPELLCKLLSALNCMMAVVRFFGRWFLPNLPNLRTWVRSPPYHRQSIVIPMRNRGASKQRGSISPRNSFIFATLSRRTAPQLRAALNSHMLYSAQHRP